MNILKPTFGDRLRRFVAFLQEADELVEISPKLLEIADAIDEDANTGKRRAAPKEDKEARPASRHRADTLRVQIIQIAIEQEGVFNAPKLYERLRNVEPFKGVNPTTVSHALRAAAREGKLQIVEHGAGKRATRYRSPSSTT